MSAPFFIARLVASAFRAQGHRLSPRHKTAVREWIVRQWIARTRKAQEGI